MKFIDFFDNEYIHFRSSFILRIDEYPHKRLMEKSSKYQEIYKKREELFRNFEFIVDLTENRIPKKELYERKDIEALMNFFEYSTIINDYERLELYKLGIHDCMVMLEMVDIL